jgi:hypothetical protein
VKALPKRLERLGKTRIGVANLSIVLGRYSSAATQSDIHTNRHDYAAISKRRQRAEEKLSMQREIRGISILLPSGGSQWEQTNTTTTKSLQKPVFKTLYFVEQRDCTRRFGGKGMFPGPPTGIRSIKDSEKQGQKQGHVKSIDRLHGGY